MALMQSVGQVAQIVLGILMIVGVVWIGKWLVQKSSMFLPGGRVERLAVLLVAAAAVAVGTGMSGPIDQGMAGFAVLLGGLVVIVAYALDDDIDVIEMDDD